MSRLTSKELLLTYLLAMISLRYALKVSSGVRAGFMPVPTFARAFTSLKSTDPEYTGHQSKDTTPKSTLTAEEEERENRLLEKLQAHQSQAAKLSMAEEVRTLIAQSNGYGVLSTNSVQYSGYPTGSVVGFQLDEEGKPFFVFSSMSAHTKDVIADKRVSLVVTAKDFQGAAEGRISMIGEVNRVADQARKAALREKYLAKHKDAYWIDFGDFDFFSLDMIQTVRYVGGFARAGSVSAQQYFEAKPDPIAAFAEPVMKHMNEDHSDSTIQMIRHYVQVPVTEAKIVSLDRLGMTVKAKLDFAGGEYYKIRLPFPRPATERKEVKEVLVEMTRASSSS